MKLAPEQIAEIDETLIQKGLIYDDIKLEVIDHIASEIENQLEKNQSNFTEAFEDVFSKWQGELKLTSNWWSSGFVAPKTVIDKYALQVKKLFKFAALYDLIFSLLMATLTKIYPQEIAYTVSKTVFVAAYFFICLILLGCRFYIWKSQLKTISTKIFRDTFSASILLFGQVSFFSGNYFYRDNSVDDFGFNILKWFVPSFFMFMGVYLILIAFEHFKNEKKI